MVLTMFFIFLQWYFPRSPSRNQGSRLHQAFAIAQSSTIFYYLGIGVGKADILLTEEYGTARLKVCTSAKVRAGGARLILDYTDGVCLGHSVYLRLALLQTFNGIPSTSSHTQKDSPLRHLEYNRIFCGLGIIFSIYACIALSLSKSMAGCIINAMHKHGRPHAF